MVTIYYDHNILKHLERLEKLLEETEIDIEDHIKNSKIDRYRESKYYHYSRDKITYKIGDYKIVKDDSYYGGGGGHVDLYLYYKGKIIFSEDKGYGKYRNDVSNIYMRLESICDKIYYKFHEKCVKAYIDFEEEKRKIRLEKLKERKEKEAKLKEQKINHLKNRFKILPDCIINIIVKMMI